MPLTKHITLTTLAKLKSAKEKMTCLSLYDAPMAAIAQKSGVEMILIGDSLGMTVQGHDSTLPVTVDQIVYHTQAVCRGNQYSFIIADMPFMSYQTPEAAMLNAGRLMQAGAHMVKLEGGEWLSETVRCLSNQGIPVCAHLGLTPQSVHKLGGYRIQGRDEVQVEKIVLDAKALLAAGADCLVLECVTSELTKRIAEEVDIITIGIGAGSATDAQVLVINDVLGITGKPPKFSKNFLEQTDSISAAVENYVSEVKTGLFPQQEHTFNI